MWSRKGLTPEQALSYLDELEGLSESNFEHSENETYSRVLRKSSESNSTSEIQASDTTLENSLSVASCSYKTSDVKRSNSSDLTVTKNKNSMSPKKRNLHIERRNKMVVPANEIRAVKTAQRNILKDNPGPTFYAKQKTNKDKISIFWRLFVDNYMLKIIKNCTKTEANNKLENVNWKLSFEDLDAFIVDTKSKYVLNAFSYLGKDETRPQDQTLSENVVFRLLEPFTKKGKNVTTDNCFARVKLAEKLAKLNTTIVGTMNRSRREVPELVKSNRGDLHI
ncbi:hypothetical protein ILUMI_07776 [Ignelater luminosus]|uniref:PiggyBac transposable element-derived protein domain-containing protein n=1 Tax=Ignelater luminosus TaxID=2038154 RepID=A0A8K0D5S2_IGNLU|nr:hypothetical protein ILUMI_07776 [Ignelater luminosus]